MSEFRQINCSIRCLDQETVAKVRRGLAGSALSTVPYVCKISGESEQVQLASRDLAQAVAERIDALQDRTDALLVIAVLHTDLCECDLATLAEEPEAVVLEHLARLKDAGVLALRRIHDMNYYGVGDGAVRDEIAAAVAAVLDRG